MKSGFRPTMMSAVAVVYTVALLTADGLGWTYMHHGLVIAGVLVFSAIIASVAGWLMHQAPRPSYAFVSTVFLSIAAITGAQLILYIQAAAGVTIPGFYGQLAATSRLLTALSFAVLPVISRQKKTRTARALALALAVTAALIAAVVSPAGSSMADQGAARALGVASALAFSLGFVHLAAARQRITPWLRAGMVRVGLCGLISAILGALRGYSPLANLIGQYLSVAIYPLTYVYVLRRASAEERALVKRSLEQYASGQKALMRKLLAAREDERTRIAQQLHDDVGQMISLIIGTLNPDQGQPEELAARMSAARDMAAETLDAVRRIAHDIRPSALDDVGLVPALQAYVATYARAHAIHVDYRAIGPEDRRFSRAVESVVYRAVVEALTNVARHSGAANVSVVVDVQGTPLTALIEDDGCGFDATEPCQGMGLSTISERMSLLGGHCAIESAPGKGTTVAIRVPVKNGDEGYGFANL